ncbi:MAG: hypothetical protein QOG43_3639 [Actinomycetota bacterium]|nr:hypothetical protein [Actinomycetota bacterium]
MAEDEEGPPPARPGSRGPRVVTGDMKRSTPASRVVTGRGAAPPPEPADDPPVDDAPADESPAADSGEDATAETLVAPGRPSQARRPRVVSARPAVPSPEPEPEPEPEPDPEPEPWRPIEVTRTIPPPVHRAAPAPPPPPGTAVRPSRAPQPAPAPAPRSAADAATGKGAGLAFVLAVVSLVSAGILAIPALILAGRARRKGASTGLVTATRLVAGFSLLAWLAVAGIVIANVAQPDGVDYAKLRAGDCIDTPEGSEVRRLTVRPCDKAHDAEVFAVVIHPAAPGDAFPGATALLEYAATTCLGQPFTDYVGVPRGQSQLTEFEIVPETEAWAEGRRGLVCAVDNADRSPLTASIRGSAK